MSGPRTDQPTQPLRQLIDGWWFFSPPVTAVPDATPAEGPDPYGNPDPEWMHIDWREHLRTVELEKPAGARLLPGRDWPTRVNYVEMGAGDLTVLFVHGLSGSWQNWLENIPHFAREHRVLALDLPGFGASPLPPWEITIGAYGRLLHTFADALAVGDCVVVGSSMGGFISAEAAIAEPERFERLALVSAAGISHASMKKRPAETAARMAAAMAPLTLTAQEQALLRPRLRNLMFRGLFHDPSALRSELIWEVFHHGAGRKGLLPAVQGLVGYDFLDKLEEVAVPTLIVWGRNDHVVPPSDAAGYGRRLRNSRTVIFDHCGHLPMVERPVRFNRVLETFLRT
jgi:pimeloyl-ACP methyl ester carboxylesterase